MASSVKHPSPPKPIYPDGSRSDEFVDGDWTKLSFSDSMPFSSHSSWFPRRPAAPAAIPSLTKEPHADNTTSGNASGSKPRRKDRSFGSADSNPSSLAHGYGHHVNDFGSRYSESSPSTTHDSSHSAPPRSHLETCSSTLPSRHRTSLLSAASDALGLRKKIVSRRKPNFPSLPYTGGSMPEVIEISARNNTTVTATVGGTIAHIDHEHEERERLRDVAAQSIGLDPELLHDSYKSESRISLSSLQSPPQPVASIPPFPATLAALYPLIELSATLPKFTPPSSLLVFALAKQWKSRTIVLTSYPPSQKTHVHLFKSTSKDEKEIERLQVTEDSVIFVAEKEVGGRGNVVKFAGKDVSVKPNGAPGEERLRTMWFLQITDPAESQRWIAAIKSAVLAQRAVRAGLDISTQTNGRNEPKGDMDVMLSMHLQGIITMHQTGPSPTISPPPLSIPISPSPPPSLRSVRANAPSSSSPTTAMKGIFSATRPRSPSVEGSTVPYPPGHAEDSFGIAGTSLLTMLRTKSSMDSTSSPSHSLPLPLSNAPGKGSPAPSLRSANVPIVITASDLKISRERDTPELSTAVPEAIPPSPPAPSLATQGSLTLSLQPPPRKYKCAASITPPPLLHEQKAMYKQASGNGSVAGNFGIPSKGSGDDTLGDTSPVSLDLPSFSGGQSDLFLPSVSFGTPSSFVGEVHASEESGEVALTLQGYGNETVDLLSPRMGSVPIDKLSHGTTAINKRRSRQGIALPKQLTPPSGPPPSIPPSSEYNHRSSVESTISISVAYAVNHSTTTSSPNSPPQTRINPQSGSSLSPTFWKRASSSSAYSTSSTSTSDSRGQALMPASSGGECFPSPLKSVVGNGAPSRPASLSVSGRSLEGHIAMIKRRSMPPPRPAPNFAPPPAPAIQESPMSGSSAIPTSAPRKSFRSSIAQRALRLSLTSPKPPPSSALPPRPDEPVIARCHRRSSSTGTPDLHLIPAPSSRPTSVHLGNSNPNLFTSPPSRSLSIRQRLRILSTPPIPASHSPAQSPSSLIPSLQISTLDLSDDNDDDLRTPYFYSPQPFGLGEHIMTIRDDPSFLQLSNPIPLTAPEPPPRSPLRPMLLPPPSSSMTGDSGTPSLEPDRDFVALSPPPRRSSRHHVATATRTEKNEKNETEGPGCVLHEDSTLLALSQRGSVVSLGFVTT